MPFYNRKHPRLDTYDYSQTGCYHLTLCTQHRKPILSRIIPAASLTGRANVQLYPAGQIVEKYIQNIPAVYPGVFLVKYAVMPNHVHLLLFLDEQCKTSIPTIIRSLKRMVNRDFQESIWQDSYYDVIIRNEAMFQCEWNYIDANPDQWVEDELYVSLDCCQS